MRNSLSLAMGETDRDTSNRQPSKFVHGPEPCGNRRSFPDLKNGCHFTTGLVDTPEQIGTSLQLSLQHNIHTEPTVESKKLTETSKQQLDESTREQTVSERRTVGLRIRPCPTVERTVRS